MPDIKSEPPVDETAMKPVVLLKYSELSLPEVQQYVSTHQPLGKGLFLSENTCYWCYTYLDASGWAQLTLTHRQDDDDEDKPATLYLDDMYAFPQGAGIGGLLLRLVLERHPESVWGHINSNAKNFYTRNGFTYHDLFGDYENIIIRS